MIVEIKKPLKDKRNKNNVKPESIMKYSLGAGFQFSANQLLNCNKVYVKVTFNKKELLKLTPPTPEKQGNNNASTQT